MPERQTPGQFFDILNKRSRNYTESPVCPHAVNHGAGRTREAGRSPIPRSSLVPKKIEN
jgi:hypothetical protein